MLELSKEGTGLRRGKRRWVRWALVALAALEAALVAGYALADVPYDVPVEGVRRASLLGDFHAPRPAFHSRHQGTDIVAPRGTPVRSASRGVVIRLEEQKIGGRVVLVLGEGAILFFYAHLDRWAPGLGVGQPVERGTVLGYVGDTGNARGGVPHLHFEARPMATAFAPIDPALVLRASTPRARLVALLTSLSERR